MILHVDSLYTSCRILCIFRKYQLPACLLFFWGYRFHKPFPFPSSFRPYYLALPAGMTTLSPAHNFHSLLPVYDLQIGYVPSLLSSILSFFIYPFPLFMNGKGEPVTLLNHFRSLILLLSRDKKSTLLLS